MSSESKMADKQPPLLTTVGMSCQSFYTGRAERLMWRAIRYLTICEQFLALSSCLTVYGYDILTRLEQRKARITSTFRSHQEGDERVRRYHFRHSRLVSDYVNCSPHPGPSGHLRQESDDLAIPMLDAPAIQEIWCTQSPSTSSSSFQKHKVLTSSRFVAQTGIQLFELNQRTLPQWFTRHQRGGGSRMGIISPPPVSVQPLSPIHYIKYNVLIITEYFLFL
ncbi:uncharacterized protein LOC113748381 [Larimichthys crocea]|uniref:uncharacterized protein LOC113748381 n=1 Tax=Larimichthys crocea TaxID=215358 RepID=UPI000F5E3BB4|nr:uncharacterized protein LOC113748381 [Larimichthys crocea]